MSDFEEFEKQLSENRQGEASPAFARWFHLLATLSYLTFA